LKDSFKTLNSFIDDMVNEAETSCEAFSQFIKTREEELDIPFLKTEIPMAVEQTITGIKRVSNIIIAMKDFAHPGSKEISYSDINRGIEVTTTICRNEWKYAADLELKLDQNLPLINCVLDEINQVILNMVINSAHAIQDVIDKESNGKGKITIETRTNGTYAEILISDTGGGISTNNMAKIFDPFFTTKKVGKGTGQGLSIAHDIIVNKHKGKINVDSITGKGTTFTIKLPYSEN
jgi:signal transduction histidine kinase